MKAWPLYFNKRGSGYDDSLPIVGAVGLDLENDRILVEIADPEELSAEEQRALQDTAELLHHRIDTGVLLDRKDTGENYSMADGVQTFFAVLRGAFILKQIM